VSVPGRRSHRRRCPGGTDACLVIAAAPSVGRIQCKRPAVSAAVTDITEFPHHRIISASQNLCITEFVHHGICGLQSGSGRLAIRERPSPRDRWHRRCRRGANRPEAHRRLRKPLPACGRGAADGAMISAGASSSATDERRSRMMSAASKRSISAKPAISRRG
jgi:hypothetical protein